jgi:type I site-specific restriction endonuclease
MIEKQWFSEKPSRFGSIVFMATGSGKTFVAIMLILKFFGFEPSKLIKMSDK